MEIWKPIDWLENETPYEVSNTGKVRRIDTGYILASRPNHKGYVRVDLYSDGTRYHMLVHQIVARAFLGQPDTGMEVNHKNGDKTDNRVNNLEWITHRENLRHSYDTLNRRVSNICKPGEKNGNAKLTRQAVEEIKQLLMIGQHTQAAIAGMYDIDYRTINHIATGRRWSHITSPQQEG